MDPLNSMWTDAIPSLSEREATGGSITVAKARPASVSTTWSAEQVTLGRSESVKKIHQFNIRAIYLINNDMLLWGKTYKLLCS